MTTWCFFCVVCCRCSICFACRSRRCSKAVTWRRWVNKWMNEWVNSYFVDWMDSEWICVFREWIDNGLENTETTPHHTTHPPQHTLPLTHQIAPKPRHRSHNTTNKDTLTAPTPTPTHAPHPTLFTSCCRSITSLIKGLSHSSMFRSSIRRASWRVLRISASSSLTRT